MISGLQSCKPDIKEADHYYDLKSFFKGDSARLGRQFNVVKTVTHNGESQTKTVKVNFEEEFGIFIESDINKPSWRSSYSTKTVHDSLIYTATDPDLKTRKIIIQKSGDQIKMISIDNYSKNMLYQSAEKLTYYPDSLYLIEKDQNVRLMGDNHYVVKGVIIKI